MKEQTAEKDRSKKLLSILMEALDLESDAREEFLDQACAGDQSLRRRLNIFLAEEAGLTIEKSIEKLAADVRGIELGGSDVQLPDPVDTGARYELKGEVAHGGMGAILKVFDTNLRRNLAMKVVLEQAQGSKGGSASEVDPRMLARFLEEAQITGQLDHPGVVPVHELGLDADGRVYFTMRLVKGREFKEIIDEVHAGSDEWNRTRALGVILKVCETMSFAHDRGVLHRDLKPANVMVGRYGEVYVMDWGLARVEGAEDAHDLRLASVSMASVSAVKTDRKAARDSNLDSPLITMDGTVLGTPFYMPPEQAAGKVEDVDERSDVYAVGAMLFHLLVGHMPYHRKGERPSPHTVLAMVLQGPPTSVRELVPTLPKELAAITEKAMARDQASRYESMAELAMDLRAHLEGHVVVAHKTGRFTRVQKWILRNKALFASGVLAIVAFGAILWVAFLKSEVSNRAYEPQGAVARSRSFLEVLPGDYAIEARIRRSAEAEFESFRGSALIESSYKDRWIHESFALSAPDTGRLVRRGETWLSWTEAEQRYEFFQVDDFSKAAILCIGDKSEDPMRLTLDRARGPKDQLISEQWQLEIDDQGVMTKNIFVKGNGGTLQLLAKYRYIPKVAIR